jgi:DNA-binding CsgD family transcriptional regulator
LARYEAVQLFLERACKVRPNFGLDDTTAAAVAAICQRLDGVPLAVELAAARTRVLSPQQILDGLDDRFRLLTGGARTAVARQQTLRASVDWSYELLTDSERRLFARLSVFAGGFSLDAAEAVAGAEPVGAFAVLDLLQSLADRSLLVVADSPRSSADGVRYRMLETIRQYAGERLAASDEADIVRTGYCEFYVALAERAALHLERAEQETWADMLDVEQENVRVAFEHAHDRADADRALRFIAALFWYWVIRGHLRIGAKACRLALDLPGPVRPQVRAAALVAACHVGWFRVDASVIPLAQEAVELAREAGDRLLEGRALFHTGVWAAEGGGRVEDLETSIAIAREVGDRWGLALGLAAAGSALGDADRTAAAAPVLEEGLAVCEELGERYIANTIRYKLAGAQFRLGRTAEGEAMLRGVIAHARGTRDVYSLAAALADLGLSRAVQGSIDAGIEMLVEDVALLQGSRQTWPNHEMQAYGILGHLLFKAGRFEEARGPLETAESTGRAHSPLTDGVLALTLSLRARVEHALGEPDHARALTAEALTLVGDARTWPAVSTRHNAACIALDDGDLDTAERMTHEALATAAGADGKQASFVEALPVLDTLAVITDDPARGARLLGAVDALMQYARHVRDAYTRERYDAAVKRYRDELGADAFDAAVEEGARLSLEEAIAYAQRGRGQRRRSARGWDSLTPTELEVVKLVREGLSNPDIAERLFVSRKTVTTHLTHVFAKLGVSSRSELAVAATRRGV